MPQPASGLWVKVLLLLTGQHLSRGVKFMMTRAPLVRLCKPWELCRAIMSRFWVRRVVN